MTDATGRGHGSSGNSEVDQHHLSQIKATLNANDEHDIAALGREQQFIRKFNFWSSLGIAVCCSGSWEGISAAIAQALYSGGPTALVYGYFAAAIGGVLIASSLAELASSWPTSGALYHWICALFGPEYRPIVGYFTGTFILGTGWIAVAGAAFGVAYQTQAYVMVSHPDYAPERWHVVLMMWATILCAAGLTLTGPKVAHYMNIAGMIIHVVGYLVIIIVLLACTKDKHTAKFVFTGFQNYSGWNDGVAWCIGLLSCVYGFIAFETPAYFAEETQNASRTVPKAIFWTSITNAIVTFPFIIVLTFCMGDLDSVLASPIGSMSPTTQIYINSTGSIGAGIFMNSFSTAIAFISCSDALSAGARGLFAMARDGMFPSVLAKVSPRFDVPLNALLVVSIPTSLLSLIYLGNITAFYGFISGTLVAQMLLYSIPIACMLLAKLKSKEPRGPWRMNKMVGSIVNGAGALWAIFLLIVLSFPTALPVTADKMNYACLLVSAVIMLCGVSWLVYGRTSGYEGVLVVIDAENEAFPATNSTDDIESPKSSNKAKIDTFDG
ncbi:amino acid/polyamine transporter I [Ilyonectria destructans]|nr:amino acid/polyamine transporter I [Ilyonectria destructans]